MVDTPRQLGPDGPDNETGEEAAVEQPLTEEELSRIPSLIRTLPGYSAETRDSSAFVGWLDAFRDELVGQPREWLRRNADVVWLGRTREELVELYRTLSTADLALVMRANAATIRELTDEHARRAVLTRSFFEATTTTMASALVAVLGLL